MLQIHTCDAQLPHNRPYSEWWFRVLIGDSGGLLVGEVKFKTDVLFRAPIDYCPYCSEKLEKITEEE